MKITNAITSFKANKMSTMQANYVDKKLKEAKIIRRNLFNRQKFFPFKILCLLDRYYSWKN